MKKPSNRAADIRKLEASPAKADRIAAKRLRRAAAVGRMSLPRLLNLIVNSAKEQYEVQSRLDDGWIKTGDESSEACIYRLECDIDYAFKAITKRLRSKR